MDTIYGENKYNLQEKAYIFYRIKIVDDVKNLDCRYYRESLYCLQLNTVSKCLSKMWEMKKCSHFWGLYLYFKFTL